MRLTSLTQVSALLQKIARKRLNPPFPRKQALNDDETTVKMDSFWLCNARMKVYVHMTEDICEA